MKSYSWEEYYEKFYDWASSTQARNLSYLTSLGSADEVAEIIIVLQVEVPAVNRLLKRVIAEGYQFKSDDLVEFLCICDKALATEAVRVSASSFNTSDMENLYGYVEDDDLIDICNKNHIPLPEDLRDEEPDGEEEYDDDEEYDEDEEYADTHGGMVDGIIEGLEGLQEVLDEQSTPPIQNRQKKGRGFWPTLFAAFAGASDGVKDVGRRHNGRCNGDCAHCPPHYGYRYGRWYYGHDHSYGCEFGGNHGDGRD